MILNKFPDAKIYCFEPIPEPLEKLRRWAERISEGKVNIFNLALGDKEEVVEMFFHNEHSPSSSLLRTTEICERYYPFTKAQNTILVKMSTLDKWIESVSETLEPEVLIKMDVQCYEDRVLKGAMQTFKLAKACILEICLDKLYEEQANFKELCDMLYELGFRYSGNINQSYADDGHVIYIDAVFVRDL